MKTLLLILALLVPGSVWAEGVLTPAANPPEPLTVLSVSGIPFIKASSGTMGNNGAVSAMTALPRIFSSGAYLWLPAGAIAAGVPASASWYWFVASSTTAGTVYNSTYTSGKPAPGVLTAFATTGPGAFTGSTSVVTAVSIPVPANAMGRNGRVEIYTSLSVNNSGGNKSPAIKWGGDTCWSATFTTQTSSVQHCSITNRGTLSVQNLSAIYASSAANVSGTNVAVDSTHNTATEITATVTLYTAVATDHAILENHRIEVVNAN